MAASTLKIAIATAVTAIGLALAAPALAGPTLPSKTFDPNADGPGVVPQTHEQRVRPRFNELQGSRWSSTSTST